MTADSTTSTASKADQATVSFPEGTPSPAAATTPGGVDVAEVRRVAELANLELTPREEAAMLRDLNAILGHVAQLNELDTSKIEPMTQVAEVLADSGTVNAALREDVPRPSFDRGPVMQQAPATDGVFFKVPKVIER